MAARGITLVRVLVLAVSKNNRFFSPLLTCVRPAVFCSMRASAEQLLRTSSLDDMPIRFHTYLDVVPVCDGLLQGARQHHLRYHASLDDGGPPRARYRWPRAREPRHGAPRARGGPGRRATDLGKSRKRGRRRARTAREAALTKREHEEGRHREHLQGLGRGEAQRRGLLPRVQPHRSTAASAKGVFYS